MPIPTRFDHKIVEIEQLAASIQTSLGTMHRGRFRTTTTGDIRVATRTFERDRAMAALKTRLQDYADAVMALASEADDA